MAEDRVLIRMLETGVPGLDRVLGGGLPQYSFNLVAGAPGAGKTTLTQHIMYANAASGCRVLHFTVLGEPPLKLLRYQQQFSFFDPDMVQSSILYRNLSDEVLSEDLDTVFDAIVREVEETDPHLIVVDSFRTVLRSGSGSGQGEQALQRFLQKLSLYLTSREVTSFLVGEYQESEIRDNPVFTIADGIIWLHQAVERNTTVRKIQALKVRGTAPMPGLHSFRITPDGVRVFPRTDVSTSGFSPERTNARLSTGVAGLDQLTGGGIPAGDSLLVAGPSGSGKTVLGSHFIAAGLDAGERAVLAVFEEMPAAYLKRAAALGLDLQPAIDRGDLRILSLRPLDLSADEALHVIEKAMADSDASRLVIDSLSGFEVALAQTMHQEFRESLYRMVTGLTGAGATVFMTVENTEDYTKLRFSPHAVSFLTDDIILQRFVEIDGELRQVLAVVKMRGSAHDRHWHSYAITERGLALGGPLSDYRGIVTGVPVPRSAGQLPG
jgi:circadian clock protein KaiC